MAGEWIAVGVDLHEKEEVAGIVGATALSEDEVVGKLVRVWAWADQQTEDGRFELKRMCNADALLMQKIDRLVGFDGFAQAMHDVGWLERFRHGIFLPEFTTYNSKSGKKRLLTARRVAKHRSKKTKRSGNADVTPDASPTAQPTCTESVPSTSEASDGTPSEANMNGSLALPPGRYQESLEEVLTVWRRYRPKAPTTISERGKSYLIKAVDMESKPGDNVARAKEVLQERSDLKTPNLLLKILAEG